MKQKEVITNKMRRERFKHKLISLAAFAALIILTMMSVCKDGV